MVVSDVLSAISDDKSLVLFNTIALARGDSSILISRLDLTRKQYYSRMSELTSAGLVRRINGKYFVTSFGKVVYKAQELIGMAAQYSSKLQAIDSVESPGFPAAELSKIIDTLISNSEIKEILVR
jgi:predicted transcriptional regulator